MPSYLVTYYFEACLCGVLGKEIGIQVGRLNKMSCSPHGGPNSNKKVEADHVFAPPDR